MDSPTTATMIDALPAKQRQVLEAIMAFITDNGYPPSIQQLCQACGVSSTSTIHYHLTALKKKGYLHWNESERRAITVNESVMGPRGGHGQVPICGSIAAGQPARHERLHQFNPGAHVLRRCPVTHDSIKPLRGLGVSSGTVCGEPENLARGMPHGRCIRGHFPDTGLHLVETDRVDQQIAGTDARNVPRQSTDAVVGGNCIEGVNSGLRVSGFRLGCGKADAGQLRVTASTFGHLRQGRNHVLGRFLAFTDGLVVSLAGSARGSGLIPLPEAVAAGRHDNQYGSADHVRAETVPRLVKLIAAQLLVDLAEEIAHL